MDTVTYAEAVELLKKTNDLLIDVGKLAMEVQAVMFRVLGETCLPIDDVVPVLTPNTEVAGHG